MVLPYSQNGHADYFSLGKYPNESYYDAESGEVEFYPLSWNTIFVTHENKIWKTENGGATWDTLYEFGTDVNARAMQFEISRSNPAVMYLFQRDENTWDEGLLFRTEDGGHTWDTLNLPDGCARRAVMAIHERNENILWIAYPDGNDGEKIFKTMDGGQSWENLTTPELNGEHITYILRYGTGSLFDGSIYVGTFRTIWWLDDLINNWSPYNEGLPKNISTCILRPFYRDHKIRMGAYGKGIWEAPFITPSDPVPQPMANKLVTSCPGDTIEFDDYSILEHSILSSYRWHFEGGTPTQSEERNPKVVFKEPGEYNVTLNLLYNDDILVGKTVPDMIRVLEPVINTTPPDIDFSSSDHFSINNPDGGITWTPIELTTCDTEGDTAMFVNNYEYSSYGQDEILLPVNMDLTQVESAILRFNVAYAPYYDGNAFIDSLHVLISNNCEKSFNYLFRSGGEELSTTTSGQGPNNLYEYDRFTPENCEEWREVEIDVAEYIGQYVTIKFLNKSGYGNQMYLDDIGIETILVGTKEMDKPVSFSIQPNPTSGDFIITTSIENAKMEIVDATGRMVFSKSNLKTKETISIENEAPGVYYVKLISFNGNCLIRKAVKL